jgi:hypothetical protein
VPGQKVVIGRMCIRIEADFVIGRLVTIPLSRLYQQTCHEGTRLVFVDFIDRSVCKIAIAVAMAGR